MLTVPRNASSCIEIKLVENSQPHFNFENYKLVFVVKRRQTDLDSEALIFKMTGDADVTISNNWQAKVQLHPADTNIDLARNSISYYYEHRLTNGVDSQLLETDRFVIEQTLLRTP